MRSFAYDEQSFFSADGASAEVAEKRRAGFHALAESFEKQFPKTLKAAETFLDGISDLRFTDTNRVPFPFQKLVREKLNVASLAVSSEGESAAATQSAGHGAGASRIRSKGPGGAGNAGNSNARHVTRSNRGSVAFSAASAPESREKSRRVDAEVSRTSSECVIFFLRRMGVSDQPPLHAEPSAAGSGSASLMPATAQAGSGATCGAPSTERPVVASTARSTKPPRGSAVRTGQ